MIKKINKNLKRFKSTSNFFKKKRLIFGFSIVEVLFYLAILTTISIFVVDSFITILSSFNTTNANHKILGSGSFVMERMSREIRQAKNIDISNSTFGTNPGVLQLNSINSSGDNIIMKFTVVNQVLYLFKDGILVGNLTDNTKITNLIFRKITTTEGEGVKIEMTMEYSNNRITKTENFYNTIILRGGY